MKALLGNFLLISLTSGLILSLPFLMMAKTPNTENGQAAAPISSADRLVVLWTSGDRDVALNMVFMYTLNAKKNHWWADITFIVWGPSAKLLASDPELKEQVTKMKEAGIVLEACKACADRYGVSGMLQELGIDVKYMGQPLTQYIKEGRHILTF